MPDPNRILSAVEQHKRLTIPELVARVGLPVRDFIKSLLVLDDLGVIRIEQAQARFELAQFLENEALALERKSLAEQRAALFRYVLSGNNSLRSAIVALVDSAN